MRVQRGRANVAAPERRNVTGPAGAFAVGVADGIRLANMPAGFGSDRDAGSDPQLDHANVQPLAPVDQSIERSRVWLKGELTRTTCDHAAVAENNCARKCGQRYGRFPRRLAFTIGGQVCCGSEPIRLKLRLWRGRRNRQPDCRVPAEKYCAEYRRNEAAQREGVGLQRTHGRQ